MHYQQELDKIFANGDLWKHRTFRTVFDPNSSEYNRTTMSQKFEIMNKCILNNLNLSELVNGYKQFYKEENKPHVIDTLEDGLIRIREFNQSNVPTLFDLEYETLNFFKKYWNKGNGKVPEWGKFWDFNSALPGKDNKGCYALLKNDEILYIGVGLGKGTLNDPNSGLGSRLTKYWEVNKNPEVQNKYVPKSNWNEMTSIRTIAIPNEHFWIAAALEIYLIIKLTPLRNTLHK